jgi:hypothetical protein
MIRTFSLQASANRGYLSSQKHPRGITGRLSKPNSQNVFTDCLDYDAVTGLIADALCP